MTEYPHRFPPHGLHLLAFSGYSQSGKDTICGLLQQRGIFDYPVRVLSFADPMRSITSIFRGDIETYRANNPGGYRQDMQALGERGLWLFGESVWVDALAHKYRGVRGTVPGVVVAISDLRRPVELDWIRGCGGTVIFMQREGTRKLNEAESEQHYDFIRSEADLIINNNGTPEDAYDTLVRFGDQRFISGRTYSSLPRSL